MKEEKFICRWQIESGEEDEGINCRAYPEHPKCVYRANDVIPKTVDGKIQYHLDNCTNFTPNEGIEKIVK